MARVDYDRHAEQYQLGRQGPLERLAAWTDAIGMYLPNTEAPILDLGAGTGIWMRAFSTWFDKPVIGVEPSKGMRRVGCTEGLEPNTWLVAGRAEALPLAPHSCSMAWLSTVVHHLDDLRTCARELRRVLCPGAPILIRNSFRHRHHQVMLIHFFAAARNVANTSPGVDEVADAFATASFETRALMRVQEPTFPSLQAIRDWAMSMRHTDSLLAPLSDGEFAQGLRAIDVAIIEGVAPIPMGLDLLVLA